MATQTGIAEELLARKKQLVTLMHLNQQIDRDSQQLQWPEDLAGWQRSLLAVPLSRILSGADAGVEAS